MTHKNGNAEESRVKMWVHLHRQVAKDVVNQNYTAGKGKQPGSGQKQL